MPETTISEFYDEFETEYQLKNQDRRARRKRKQKTAYAPKKPEHLILQEIADTTGIEGDFDMSYRPARHERIWLYESLKAFYQEDLITDVLSLVKGGKEANVYRCRAHESTGTSFLAVKVYRPRMFRNLRNDKLYREGRTLLSDNGRPVKERDKRAFRALNKKTSYGQQLAHTSWLMHEFTALRTLHAMDADVPRPYSALENAILMQYVGDEHMPAPPLHTVTLPAREAEALFERSLQNIELMLQQGMIHADLSEYNILYWESEITLIDFPQVIKIASNRNAEKILKRDISRVCQYFDRYGIGARAEAIHEKLWQKYGIVDDEAMLSAEL